MNNRVRRAHRSRVSAQAVIETALVLPILLTLVAGFLAACIQVQTANEVETAVSLATQSMFQAQRGQTDFSGVLTGCRYANETYTRTISFYQQYLFLFNAPICNGAGYNAPIQCSIASNYTTASCTATVRLNFYETPLAWAIPWNPIITATSTAVPPPVRQ